MVSYLSGKNIRCHSLSSLSYQNLNSLIRELADNAPRELVDEVRASHDMSVAEAAHHSCKGCLEGFVIQFNGRVAGITGVTEIDYTTGCPWLLATPAAYSEPRAFLVMSRALLKRWAEIYTLQLNYIDPRFQQALRWARHAGFDLQEVVPFGPFDMPFQKIVYRKK